VQGGIANLLIGAVVLGGPEARPGACRVVSRTCSLAQWS